MRVVAIVLAFILELWAFAAYAYAGFAAPIAGVYKVLFGLGFITIVITFWGMFMAPKASKRLNLLPYRIAKTVIFGLAAVILLLYDHTKLALIFAALTVIDEILLARYEGGRTKSR
jgi:hypothetical protein